MNKLPGLFVLTTLAVAQVTSISPGTSITVRTNEAIYARQSDGRVFTGIVEQDVPDVNGNVAIARGSQVELTARNVSGNELVLDLESVTTNGQRFAVTAEADRVGSSRGQAIGANRRTGEYVGGGALLGTIIGAIAGGGRGAAIGAAAGAAAGVGTEVLTRGQSLNIPAESLLTFRLEQPLQIGVADNGYFREGSHYHYPNGGAYDPNARGYGAARASTVACASYGRRVYCTADTSGSVRLVSQSNGSRCRQGSTWGYDTRGIWVDRNCRGQFEVTGSEAVNYNSSTIACSSDNGQRNYCNVDTRRGVRLVRQLSGSACQEGATWGYDARGIWVDRGCRAEFDLSGRVSNNSGNYNSGAITCSSDNGQRNYCSADTAGGVRLVRQLSGASCQEGATWGYDARGIWVDRGCRAEFDVAPQGRR